MPDINNPITDALDEMLARKATHMIIETDCRPQLLVDGKVQTPNLPVMTSDEIIEDLAAIGLSRNILTNCNFFYAPEDKNDVHTFRLNMTEVDERFFIAIEHVKTSVQIPDEEEWTEF